MRPFPATVVVKGEVYDAFYAEEPATRYDCPGCDFTTNEPGCRAAVAQHRCYSDPTALREALVWVKRVSTTSEEEPK